jgi:hypothetical protein
MFLSITSFSFRCVVGKLPMTWSVIFPSMPSLDILLHMKNMSYILHRPFNLLELASNLTHNVKGEERHTVVLHHHILLLLNASACCIHEAIICRAYAGSPTTYYWSFFLYFKIKDQKQRSYTVCIICHGESCSREEVTWTNILVSY